MRVAVVVALGVGLGLLSACASEKLALAPPASVDFSGHWRLNEAESDDPLRLVQSQVDPSRVGGPGAQGGQGGQGRQGRGRGGPGGGMGMGTGVGGPVMPGVGALGEGLRWPGKEIEIKQVAGVVALTSGGVNQVYQPSSTDMKPHRHKHPDGGHGRDGGGPGGGGPSGGGPGGSDSRDPGDRDMPERDRGEGAPALCGWDGKILVVQGGDPDDERPSFEERYSISEDGQRLVEVIAFKGGRSGGFTMSRTWDRVVP
jgi:hypothetical protein